MKAMRGAGEGGMSSRIHAFDWSTTPLGPIETWPASLRVALTMVLDHPFPMALAWGPELTTLYNDAYRPLLGGKPEALGRPFLDVWAEARDAIAPQIARALAEETPRFEGAPFTLLRGGRPEKAYFDYAFSPVRDESGAVAGVLNTAFEITSRVLAEQERSQAVDALRTSKERQIFLLKLTDALRPLRDPVAIQHAAMTLLAEQLDVMRATYFEADADEDGFTLTARHERSTVPMPQHVRLSDFTPDMAAAYRAGKTLIVRDTESDDRTGSQPEAYRAIGIRAWAGAPLVKDNRLIAIVGIHSATPRDWTNAEIHLLEDVAERIWAAVERARAEAVSRESEVRLEVELADTRQLHRISSRLIVEDNIDAVYADILDVARSLMRSDMASIQRFVPERRDLFLLGQHGFKPESEKFWEWVAADDTTSCGVALARGEPVIVPDVETWDFVAGTEDLDHYRLCGIRSMLSVPLVSRGGGLVGVMSTHWREVHEPSDRELRLLDVLARQAADLIERNAAAIALREQAALSAGQKESFQAAVRDAPLTESLGILVRTALAHYGEEMRCAFYLADAEGAELAHVVGMPEPYALCVDGFRIGSDSLACGLAVYTGRPVITADVNEEPRWADWLWLAEQYGYRAVWSFPIETSAGKVVGTFAMYFAEPREAGPRDVEFADVLTRAAAIIVSRHQHANERACAEAALRESEERLRQFGEASQDVLWIRDAETLQWQYLTPAFETIYGLSREEALSGDNYRSWLELIMPEDRARAAEAIGRVRDGEHAMFEYRVRRPTDGAIRWLRNTDFPIVDANGKVTLVGGIGVDITKAKLSQEVIERSEERLRSAGEVGRLGLWDWNVRTGEVHWSDEHFRMEGYAVGEVTPSYDAWASRIHPDDRAQTETALRQAMQAHEEYMQEFRVVHPDGAIRWLYGRGRFFYDEDGEPMRMIGAMVDTTERREWEERQKVLVAELQHRTRNLIGVVRSMADKTVRASADLADFRTRFRDRLDALARVQGLLSRLNEHDRVTFDELINSELSAMDGTAERVTLQGPLGIRLRSSTVQALAMALHELATNAVKYGALGQPEGRLDIEWSFEPSGEQSQPWLHIDWRESAVDMPPANAAPQGTGQGRELIERALPYQLDAKTSYTLGVDGVHCTISIPVSASSTEEHQDD